MPLEQTTTNEVISKIPSKELGSLSSGAYQLFQLLTRDGCKPINSRVLWTKLALTREREPFSALWKLREEMNEKLSGYGEVDEAPAVHGRPFVWKPRTDTINT